MSDTLYSHGRVIYEGKVVDVMRRTVDGFARGNAWIAPHDDGPRLELHFQNEHLIARVGDRVRAIVPDLICVLEADTAEPITTESLRYGQRVRVFAHLHARRHADARGPGGLRPGRVRPRGCLPARRVARVS